MRAVDNTNRGIAEREYSVREKVTLWHFKHPQAIATAITARNKPFASAAKELSNNFGRAIDFSLLSVIRSEPLIRLQSSTGASVNASENRVVIGFRSLGETRADLIVRYHLTELWFDDIGNFGVYSFENIGLEELFDALRSENVVLFADPDVRDGDDTFMIQTDEEDATPEVEFPPDLWNHKMVGVSENGKEADGTGVVVAVVDGRADLGHPTIKDALLLGGLELLFADDLPIVDHGVGVMSVIAGQRALADGERVGVAPSAKLIQLAISTYSISSYVERAKAINFAAKIAESRYVDGPDGVRIEVPRLIVNCSWKLRSAVDLTAVALAFDRLVKSAICVCSAGNENTDLPHFPSEYPGVVRVAALGITGERMSMSNFGTTVTFSAPGGTDAPTDANDILMASLNNKHAFGMGTSFAAPHVAGLLATIWSRNSELNHEEVLQLAKTKFIAPISDSNAKYAGKLGLGILTLQPSAEV
ncbi:S8 family peptidase [Rhizobium ruizarguesonis]|jgi:subtilisin family serine protease|uniref:S8 family peptidase n=1 Tax=Rhizobium ruizarguesonis TaxID=2081791 RepID=UPI0010310272|nr:S8 family serine peptidase [Rhizobium ruizarguesonis]TBE99683.1 hypothetical protein ELG98_25420 [Rhizobium ruizarguesonis]